MMRILVANKFWYRRGGLERVMFDEIAWLEAAGHEVAHFSTRHPDNDASPWSEHFVPYIELGVGASLTRRERVLAAERVFWNLEAARKFARLLHAFRPDVLHVHAIHRQISPSILAEARRAGIPVVQTLHDYHLVCASGDLLFAGSRACDPPRCGRVHVLPCTLSSCVQHSKTKSALASAELLWRRWIVRYEGSVDAFISPSHALARIVAAGGIGHRPIHVLPNAVPIRTGADGGVAGDAFVYAGRLSQEKGLVTLMRAAELARVPLIVAGSGPLRDQLMDRAPVGVRFLGRLSGEEVERLLAGCRAAVVPSEWAENAPMAVLEPMALGRPVVASRIGGIPEQMRDGVDGILFPPGDQLDLAAALRLLADDRELAERLGRAARAHVASHFSPQTHIDGLLDIYRSVLRQRPLVRPTRRPRLAQAG